MEKEYSISVDDRIREDVSDMCNLSQGIRERGRAEGILQGIEQGIDRAHNLITETIKQRTEFLQNGLLHFYFFPCNLQKIGV
ncbi:MAG: hypothetical protein NC433_06510 [Clostridiales bacterium]|nr:hypothetical protein [Clostridiales bacterium]